MTDVLSPRLPDRSSPKAFLHLFTQSFILPERSQGVVTITTNRLDVTLMSQCPRVGGDGAVCTPYGPSDTQGCRPGPWTQARRFVAEKFLGVGSGGERRKWDGAELSKAEL